MGTLKSSGANLTINADGSGNDIKFQSNGSEVASIDQSGNLALNGTVDGRDIATDGTKLDGIEASADVTDATNVTAAGALMDSEVTNLAAVKSFAASDYATAAQGTTADAALPKSGGSMSGNLTMNANEIIGDDNAEIRLGSSTDLKFYHDGNNSYIKETGTGSLKMWTSQLEVLSANGNENQIVATENGAVDLYHNNAKKIETTSGGATVTGTLGVTTVDLGNWTITESSGVLYFATGGTNKMKLDASGNLTCVGDVTANGSM